MKMKNQNSVTLTGRLGNDPSEVPLPSGSPKVVARLATDNSEGTEPTWHSLVAWNGAAEKLKGHQKGHKITVSGRVRKSTWEDSQGRTRHETEIIVLDVKEALGDEPPRNHVVLLGHLARDVRVGVTQSKRTVANLTVVTNRAYPKSHDPKGPDDWANEATYHDVVAFDVLAESLKGLKKGDPVGVEGTLVYRRSAETEKHPARIWCDVHADNVSRIVRPDESSETSQTAGSDEARLPADDTGSDDW